MRTRPATAATRKASGPGKPQQGGRICDRADVGRNDVGNDQHAVRPQLLPPQAEQRGQFVALHILNERIGDQQVDGPRSKLRGTRRVNHLGVGNAGNTLRQLLANPLGCLAQQEPTAMGGNVGRVQRLAAAVVQDGSMRRRNVTDDVTPHGAGMQQLVPVVDIDGVLAVPELDPAFHFVGSLLLRWNCSRIFAHGSGRSCRGVKMSMSAAGFPSGWRGR